MHHVLGVVEVEWVQWQYYYCSSELAELFVRALLRRVHVPTANQKPAAHELPSSRAIKLSRWAALTTCKHGCSPCPTMDLPDNADSTVRKTKNPLNIARSMTVLTLVP